MADASPKQQNPLVPIFFGLLILICLLSALIMARGNSESGTDRESYDALLYCLECAETGDEINLWNSPERTRVVARAPHGSRVAILQTEQGPDGRNYMLVRAVSTGAEGWVSEPFVRRIDP